ncbi:hypothetical protein IWQ60_012418 [Tieghemiomyces parasiticus]|uniref:Uncharacterized protein n=1 Tax=Tieghemiomyces parasiticus TaxID=78921 RepID=A0A9W8DGF9_9FUNG|nr:hypothetical protein IWQ60_012418 [Tieghemiomyces parasiticus]
MSARIPPQRSTSTAAADDSQAHSMGDHIPRSDTTARQERTVFTSLLTEAHRFTALAASPSTAGYARSRLYRAMADEYAALDADPMDPAPPMGGDKSL